MPVHGKRTLSIRVRMSSGSVTQWELVKESNPHRLQAGLRAELLLAQLPFRVGPRGAVRVLLKLQVR